MPDFKKLIGDSNNFEVSHRILNAFALVGILLTLITAARSLLQALPIITFYFNIANATIVAGLLWYSLKYKNFIVTYRFAFTYLTLVFFPGIWFISNGTMGGFQFFYFLLIVMIVLITRGRDTLFFVAMVSLVMIFLILSEVFFPDLTVKYSSNTSRYIDITIGLLIAMFGVFIILNIYKKLYINSIEMIEMQNLELQSKKEEISEQKEELQTLNEDKDRFIQILGHDLRNPFNTLMGLSETLNEEIEMHNKEEIAQMAGIMNKVSKKTFNLLTDLILWSKSQSGQLPFDPRETEIEDIFKSVLIDLEEMAQQKDIKIFYQEPVKTKVFVDQNMMKTVFRNLINNAIKFSYRSNGIHIYTNHDKNKTTITFADNGMGILPESIDKLWDRSTPFTTSGTEDEQGTGLGLLLCKEFVERHDGKIWVESEYEKGSNFIIELGSKVQNGFKKK